MLQIDLDELKKVSSENAFEIMQQMIARLSRRKDQLQYEQVFLDYYSVTRKDFLDARVEDLKLYFDELYSRPQANSTSAKKHRMLAALFRFTQRLKEDGSELVPDTFCNDMRLFSPSQYDDAISEKKLPDLSDIDKLVGYFRGNDEMLLVLSFSFKCMLYLKDIPELSTDNFYWTSDGQCYVHIPSRQHTAAVPDDLAGLLERYIGSRKCEGRLFPVTGAVTSWYRARQYDLKRACTALGIEPCTFNSLRNSAIVYAHSNGMPAEELAKAAGYKSLRHIRHLTSLTLDVPRTEKYLNIYFRTA